MAARSSRRRLEVRVAQVSDVEGIIALVGRAYDRISGYSRGQVRGQINHYPEGQFVALYDGTIVGYCASMRLDEDVALSIHDWEEITANGFGSRHDPTGAWLYGY
jgi:ribosomal protein S18 acetylase RimI-like enzyme